MPSYPSLKDADLKDKRVLLRAGFDVPIEDGKVVDTSRIEAMVPTIKYLLEQGAAVIIMAHQGRPKGQRIPEMSQQPLVPILSEHLGVDVQFCEECTGSKAEEMTESIVPGEVLLLENLRYDVREKKNEPSMGEELGKLADVYVNDAFTNCHREHASMVAVTKHLPSYMGLQLEKEIEHLSQIVDDPKHPLVLVVSGAKMETKVPIIEHFLNKSDHVLLGGCIANTCIAAEGFDVGESKYEDEWVETAQNIMLEGDKDTNATVHVPTDVVVASEPTEDAQTLDLPLEDIEGDMKIFDIGRETLDHYVSVIENAGMIIWNGPLGFYELTPFSNGSKRLAEAIKSATEGGAISIIGGGDTIDVHKRYNLDLDVYSFVSTGGGAMMEFIAGKELPALKALLDAA